MKTALKIAMLKMDRVVEDTKIRLVRKSWLKEIRYIWPTIRKAINDYEQLRIDLMVYKHDENGRRIKVHNNAVEYMRSQYYDNMVEIDKLQKQLSFAKVIIRQLSDADELIKQLDAIEGKYELQRETPLTAHGYERNRYPRNE